jgi:hypothetical protein
MRLAVLITLLAAAAATPALAAPAYVGTWGIDAEMCAKPEDQVGAPVMLGSTSFDQFESHCTFGKIKRTVKGKTTKWTTRATCSIEGDKQVGPLVMTMKNGTLSMAWDGAVPQDYQNCSQY